jgi:hypothetical protein
MKYPLHIISFDVPYPADYGGVIDVFNRLKALHKSGFSIILHCFDYGRGKQTELENYAEKVYYYKRKSKTLNLLKKEPMIVASRKSAKLLQNLLQQEGPILFEGQHTTALLNHPLLKNRKKIVRVHNIEHEYYEGLSNTVGFGYKKSYFKSEAKKLRKHEHVLMHANALLCIHPDDVKYYSKMHKKVKLLSPIFSFEKTNYSPGQGDFILFHGNLSVGENSEAAQWLLDNVASQTEVKIVFAGKNPSNDLKKAVRKYSHCKIIANPDKNELEELLNEAKAHLLITFRPSGVKIKLLKALSTSSLVICNSDLVSGTLLKDYCTIANTAKDVLTAIHSVEELSEEAFTERRDFIQHHYSPEKHAKVIADLI